MLKKLISSVILAVFLLFTLIIPYAKAQVRQGGTWYHPTFDEYVQKVYDQSNEDEIFGERYTQAQVVWIIHALKAALLPQQLTSCFSGSFVIENIGNCLSSWIEPMLSANVLDPKNTSLASIVNQMVSSPVSGIGYIWGKLANLHIVPEAKAQTGFGFGQLSSVQVIWGVFRNISYFLLALSFIVLAFMIMFRVRISPQTVITIQSAIPKIIFTLLFITFSFAIAGLLIDLSYVAVGLLALAGDASSSLNSVGLFSALLSAHPILAMMLIILIYFIGIQVVLGPATAASYIISLGILAPLFLILDVVIFLVILFVFLIIWVRLIWVLLRTFINIVLLIVFSPILILTGIFPGGGGFGSWLRNLSSQLAVYPVFIAMLYLSHFFFWTSVSPNVTLDLNDRSTYIPALFSWLGQNNNLLNPYGIDRIGTAGQISLPGFALGGTGITFGIIVALGILFLVPSVTNIIQSAISGRPFAYGTAIGAALATGWAIGGFPLYYPWGIVKSGYEKKAVEQIGAEGWRAIFKAFRPGGSTAKGT